MASLSKARNLYRKRGIISLIKRGIGFSYETFLRTRLPRRKVTYNDVKVRGARAFDTLLPWEQADLPGYESSLVNSMEAVIDTGDTVVVVGGGWGVSTVTAARQAGPDGSVYTFEAATETAETVRETVTLNDVSNRVSVDNAIVAKDISTRGSSVEANVISPLELPSCDVLVLDCEGAELSIIDGIQPLPRAVVVETHGHLDAPPEMVQERLKNRGYTVTDDGIAEPRKEPFCRDNGIHVLRATRGKS